MRLQKSLYPQNDASKENDFPFTFSKEGDFYEIRILKIPLYMGETEFLITNLIPQLVGTTTFKALYSKWWPIETRYNTLQHKLKIEQFTEKNGNLYPTGFLCYLTFIKSGKFPKNSY